MSARLLYTQIPSLFCLTFLKTHPSHIPHLYSQSLSSSAAGYHWGHHLLFHILPWNPPQDRSALKTSAVVCQLTLCLDNEACFHVFFLESCVICFASNPAVPPRKNRKFGKKNPKNHNNLIWNPIFGFILKKIQKHPGHFTLHFKWSMFHFSCFRCRLTLHLKKLWSYCKVQREALLSGAKLPF